MLFSFRWELPKKLISMTYIYILGPKFVKSHILLALTFNFRLLCRLVAASFFLLNSNKLVAVNKSCQFKYKNCLDKIDRIFQCNIIVYNRIDCKYKHWNSMRNGSLFSRLTFSRRNIVMRFRFFFLLNIHNIGLNVYWNSLFLRPFSAAVAYAVVILFYILLRFDFLHFLFVCRAFSKRAKHRYFCMRFLMKQL